MDMIRVDQQGSQKVIGKVCDRCHYAVESPDRNGEMEEFLRIRFEAGYCSRVYYDGDVLQADFCQYCVRHLLGPYLRLQADEDDQPHESGPSASLLDLLREDPEQEERERRRRPLSDVYRGQ
ncbi:hypothetical protein [Algiphilus sp.]|uniref:hypothetical protein n=1 Tax=Algiphilus sp. TaxID=1872431 RepID=UPI003BAD1F51